MLTKHQTDVLESLLMVWGEREKSAHGEKIISLPFIDGQRAAGRERGIQSCRCDLQAAMRALATPNCEPALLCWTSSPPTVEGAYLLAHRGMRVTLAFVFKGSWQQAQNPEWIYFSIVNTGVSRPVQEAGNCKWFGPIADPFMPHGS